MDGPRNTMTTILRVASAGTGPRIDPARFAPVENAAQTLRALAALLAMETSPTPTGESARRATLAALARMR